MASHNEASLTGTKNPSTILVSESLFNLASIVLKENASSIPGDENPDPTTHNRSTQLLSSTTLVKMLSKLQEAVDKKTWADEHPANRTELISEIHNLQRYDMGNGVRVDSGVSDDSDNTVEYDDMMARSMTLTDENFSDTTQSMGEMTEPSGENEQRTV